MARSPAQHARLRDAGRGSGGEPRRGPSGDSVRRGGPALRASPATHGPDVLERWTTTGYVVRDGPRTVEVKMLLFVAAGEARRCPPPGGGEGQAGAPFGSARVRPAMRAGLSAAWRTASGASWTMRRSSERALALRPDGGHAAAPPRRADLHPGAALIEIVLLRPQPSESRRGGEGADLGAADPPRSDATATSPSAINSADALPFQTKLVPEQARRRCGIRSARRRAGAVGEHAEDLDHDGGPRRRPRGKLSSTRRRPWKRRYQDNDSARSSTSPRFWITFRDALVMMIISDNTSTGMVVDQVGLKAVQRYRESLGMKGTTHRFGIRRRLGPDHTLDQVTRPRRTTRDCCSS